MSGWLACVLLISNVHAHAQGALQIGGDKQLFLDRAVVDRCEGVQFAMNPPQRTGRIVLQADAPWEVAAGAHIGSYCSVLKEGGKVRFWYDLRIGTTAQVAYAESADGERVTKPTLGLFPLNGSTENNIVMEGRIGGASVWLDPRAEPELALRKRVVAALSSLEDESAFDATLAELDDLLAKGALAPAQRRLAALDKAAKDSTRKALVADRRGQAPRGPPAAVRQGRRGLPRGVLQAGD